MTLQTNGPFNRASRSFLAHWPGTATAVTAVLNSELFGIAPVVVVPPVEQPQTLFAQMWSASTAQPSAARRTAGADAQRIKENAAVLSQAPTETALIKEPFPAPRETTAQEMAGYTALAAAIVKAEIKQKLAEQMRLAEQARAIELAQLEHAQEMLRIEQVALEMRRALEQEEIEMLLLLA